MMDSATIDLFGVRIWALVAASIVLLAPLTGPAARRVAFAAFNLGFLALYLREGIVGVLAGVVVGHLVLRVLPSPRWGPLAMAAAGAAVLGLFLTHKLP